MIQCEKGHLWDPTKNTSCPYCEGIHQPSPPPISPAGISKGEDPTIRKVEDATIKAGSRAIEDEGTVNRWAQKSGIDPVVGWVVCIEGTSKGRDYRIRTQINTMGRSAANKIFIEGDDTISRKTHASISFDPKNMVFMLLPNESANLVYLNEEGVYTPTELKSHDIIEMGKTKLLFIPLCGERFQWDEHV